MGEERDSDAPQRVLTVVDRIAEEAIVALREHGRPLSPRNYRDAFLHQCRLRGVSAGSGSLSESGRAVGGKPSGAPTLPDDNDRVRTDNERLTALLQVSVGALSRACAGIPELASLCLSVEERLRSADPVDVQAFTEEVGLVTNALIPLVEQKQVVETAMASVRVVLDDASRESSAFADDTRGFRGRLQAVDDAEEVLALRAALLDETDRATERASAMVNRFGNLTDTIEGSQDRVRALEAALRASQKATYTDELTSLDNRRALIHWVRTQLYVDGRSFAVLVVDLDNFKGINDEHGHLVGDQVLVEMGRRLRASVRGIDCAARYGGDEFVLVLNSVDRATAKAVADRVCVLVRSRPVSLIGLNFSVTVSIGAAVSNEGDTFEQVFERADQCLYAVKRGGRDGAMIEAP